MKKAKLCDIDAYSFLVHVKSGCIYADLAGAVKKTFEASNYEAKKSLPTGRNEKKIGLMKNELGGKIMKEVVTLRQRCRAISQMMIVFTRKQWTQRNVLSKEK